MSIPCVLICCLTFVYHSWLQCSPDAVQCSTLLLELQRSTDGGQGRAAVGVDAAHDAVVAVAVAAAYVLY